MKLCILDNIDRKVENCGKVEKITGYGGKSNIDVGDTLLFVIKNNIIFIENIMISQISNRYSNCLPITWTIDRLSYP